MPLGLQNDNIEGNSLLHSNSRAYCLNAMPLVLDCPFFPGWPGLLFWDDCLYNSFSGFDGNGAFLFNDVLLVAVGSDCLYGLGLLYTVKDK